MTTQLQHQDAPITEPDGSPSIDGVPRGRAGCPMWCVDHIDEEGDDHAGRTWHLELTDWMFTATPHAWEDGGFAQHSPLHIVIEGRNYDHGARSSTDLTIGEVDQLINLLTHARDNAVSDADLCSIGKDRLAAFTPTPLGLQVRTRDMREDVAVGDDEAGNPVLWLRDRMLTSRTVCQLGVALEGFRRGAPADAVTRIAEADVGAAGIIVKDTKRILVLPRGSLEAKLLDDVNVLLSAAEAE